jgi:isoleucyl-tRNA synthetase
MPSKYPEYQGLNLPQVAEESLKYWEDNFIFQKSITSRPAENPFVFFEGPPSANGMPGIHHVMGRTIKDIFCRYKTLKGFRVDRKAGWDTHGLPVELGVEKELGITKEDIGSKISVEEYNLACREAVMKYTDVWNDMTRKAGYWVDMSAPYVTYENKYIESVWWLLKRLFDKKLIYKGYTIQPYSPAAGTGLSSHELNQPGTYRDVTDTTVIAQFRMKKGEEQSIIEYIDPAYRSDFRFDVLAWTTTPWTLPSNTALAVHPAYEYVVVRTINQYTYEVANVVVAEKLYSKYFLDHASVKLEDHGDPLNFDEALELMSADKSGVVYKSISSAFGGKQLGKVIGRMNGKHLVGLHYEQLLPFAQPVDSPEKAFRIIEGDFVTTEDGTGIVHIAPTFGADDMRVAQEAGVPPLMVLDKMGNPMPLVDLQGRFVEQMGEFAGRFVKNEYYGADQQPERSVDVDLAIKLKTEGRAFKVEKYSHSYPHCWRTDKPVLYYPLDSWFVKVTDVKERMVQLNDTINWKPASTGTGRFGNWLANANDWNLSRSRFWGIPLPIWVSEDGTESRCFGSVEELKDACATSVEAGFMETNPLADFEPGNMNEANYKSFDLHKPYVDKIVLKSSNGQRMTRELDLIDVWFDSGSMPYAQWHYPFENNDLIDNRLAFPADFIAEGVDQTRGWFYTLHAISTMCFDSVAYKNVVSNGLVLDKNGQKMSKRLGNAVDPFETLEKYGPDATRWYMITNAQPWDNLKFDEDGITEVQRKFFGTLYNTYSFFALYANVDGFAFKEDEIPLNARPEIDRWILSKLNSLIDAVDKAFGDFEPTKAGRLIQEFTVDELSNWYVRLCRRRFWKGSYSEDKISAYQTLFTCLETIARLSSPIAPFYTDQLYIDLMTAVDGGGAESVHLSDFPKARPEFIDEELENRMEIAQRVTSMVLALRKKEKIRVRQPLNKIMLPVLNEDFARRVKEVEALILSEVNIKEIQYLTDTSGVLVKQAKANFKTLGPKYGKQMKGIASEVSGWAQDQIQAFEFTGKSKFQVDGVEVDLGAEDVEIITQDIPGWTVASEGELTVAMDITIDEVLKLEGLAREFVNRIQNLRKNSGLELTDRIKLRIESDTRTDQAIENNLGYICAETLADSIDLVKGLDGGESVEIDELITTRIAIEKLN